MPITRQRLKELEEAEKKLKAMQDMATGKRAAKVPDDVDIIEDEEPDVHYSSGRNSKMGNKLPAKMMPVKKKKKWLGLRSVEDNVPDMNDLQRIKDKVTEESPEIMFQKWLEKKCKRGCHLCEECVQEIEAIIES
jgi:hypothetical protein